MKNKFWVYIFAFLILYFGLSLNVNAATKLVCNYKGGIMLIQDGNGDKVIKIVSSNVSSSTFSSINNDIDWYSDAWVVDNSKKNIVGSDTTLYDGNNFADCPGYVKYSKEVIDKASFHVYSFRDNNDFKSTTKKLSGTVSYDDYVDFETGSNIKELLCVYANGVAMFSQDKDGSLKFYRANSDGKTDPGYDSDKWWESHGQVGSASKTSYYNGKYFTACPAYVTWSSPNFKFYDEKKFWNVAFSRLIDSNHSPSDLKVAQSDIEEKKALYTIDKTPENKFKVSNNYGEGLACVNADWLTNISDYSNSCLYTKSVKFDGKNICHVVQISMDDKGKIFDATSLQTFSEYSDVDISENFKAEDLSYVSNCPSLYVSIDSLSNPNKPIVRIALQDSSETVNGIYRKYDKYDSAKSNWVNPLIQSLYEENSTPKTCEDLFSGENGDKIVSYLRGFVTLIKILVPILLIGLGVADFGSAVFAGDEDKIKKAQSRFVKRLLIGVVIFLIPTLLQFILSIVHSIWGIGDPDMCGILKG